MGDVRKSHSPQLKFQVAALAATGKYTLAELSSQFGVHSADISRWKKVLTDNGPNLFSKKTDKVALDLERQLIDARLLIGKQAIMLEDVKKKLGY
jgi:putative transposase